LAFLCADVADFFRCRHTVPIEGHPRPAERVLMAKEQLEHTALWPQCWQALSRGCKSQLKRSHLVVGGVHVHMPFFALAPSSSCFLFSLQVLVVFNASCFLTFSLLPFRFLHLVFVEVGYERDDPV